MARPAAAADEVMLEEADDVVGGGGRGGSRDEGERSLAPFEADLLPLLPLSEESVDEW